MLIVAAHVSQQSNDKKEIAPAIAELDRLPKELGKVTQAIADTGYFSDTNVKILEAAEIIALNAVGREAHNISLAVRFSSEPLPKSWIHEMEIFFF